MGFIFSTHFWSMFPFPTPWKQKTFGFQMVKNGNIDQKWVKDNSHSAHQKPIFLRKNAFMKCWDKVHKITTA